jgi:Fe-S-cluster containining protein
MASQGSFSCHRCGACCTDLRDRNPSPGFAEPAPGVYRQPGSGGLRVFTWETDPFPDERLRPRLVAADADREARIVLAHELAADDCPNYDADTSACTVYEERPLVCRAFPLVLADGDEGPELAASAICGARVPLTGFDEGSLAQVYPDAWAPAVAIPALWRWLVHLVGFLDDAGAIQLRAGLGEPELARFEATIGLDEALADADVMGRDELAHRAGRRVQAIRERQR